MRESLQLSGPLDGGLSCALSWAFDLAMEDDKCSIARDILLTAEARLLENISMGIPIRQMLNVEATERVGGPDQKDTMTVDSADSQTPRITNSINARPSGEERREPGACAVCFAPAESESGGGEEDADKDLSSKTPVTPGKSLCADEKPDETSAC
jgi:hypothetical protein